MIKFSKIGKYLENSLNTITYGLYNEEDSERPISRNYNFKYYYNFGDIIDPEKDLPEDTIAVNIINDGITNDTESPLDVYLQTVDMQFLCKAEYRDDLHTILTEFTTEYKAKMDNTSNTPIQTLIDELPSFGDRQYLGNVYTTADLELDILVWNKLILSNSIELYINNSKISYSDFSTSRDYETYADMRKYAERPYSPETSTFQLSISGVYVDTDIMQQLRNDHYGNTNFGSSYTIKLIDTTTNNILLEKDMILLSSAFAYKFGQTVSYELNFTPYTILS